MMVPSGFFDLEPIALAQSLLGLVLRHRLEHPDYGAIWLSARIIETEAYYRRERGSHSSRGFTEKRKAMFMAPGTIYMYYARGGDSLNFSARGEGNAVLVKSGLAHRDRISDERSIQVMQALNPINGRSRAIERLCSGQTLLCKSLGLKVPDWNQRQLSKGRLVLEDVGAAPDRIVQCTRLGIPKGRDEHLPYRFVDYRHVRSATRNPLAGNHKVIARTPPT